MKAKFVLVAAALWLASVSAFAQEKITIGVIQYDLTDIDKSFKDLHEQGFGSCELNYRSNTLTKAFAEQVKAASKKYDIKVTTVVGVPGHSVWNFRQGPATIGLVPKVMQDLAAYAKERNVMIYFETGQETPTTLIRAIKDIGTGNVFINCDLANLLMYGKANSLDAVKQFGSLIKEFHAKDGKYPDPNNPYELGAEVPIPTGEVNFPAVISELKKQGFQGAVTIECELNGTRHDYVLKTREYLKGLLDN